jgi:transcriptional regulator with XRE-family HTH domain
MMANSYHTIYGFSERLQEALGKSGLSQVEVAKRAKISRAALGNYLCGDCLPNALYLGRLCAVLGVSADWMIGLKK